MKVFEMDFEDIFEGMRIKGHVERSGTVIYIDRNDDNYCWILWDS